MKTGSAKKKKVAKQPCLSAYCAILPSASPVLSQDVFSVSESSVNCPDAKFENTFNYRFQDVFNGLKELQGAFDRVYAPMVRQTIAGESTLMAFCGLPISESMEYFTSVNGRAGIINMTAQLLLRAACTDAKKPGTVTLSWYRIDCGPSEAITDLLRSSSSLHTQRGPDPNLVLRELGKGRGMLVPGLWEVELTTPQDADAVIGHVQKMMPTSVHDGKSHSIFQLTISPYDQTQKANYQHVGSRATIVDDSPGVGRLTMVLLSDLGPVRNASYIESPVPPVVERYDWVNIAYDILHWIESRRPSPPFHRSRVMLLLRDALCSRMHGAISLFLVPAVQSLPDNSSWLDLVTKIFHISDQRLSAVNAVNAAAKALTDAQTNALLAAAAAANIPPPGRFSREQRDAVALEELARSRLGKSKKAASGTPHSKLESSMLANHEKVQQKSWGLEGRDGKDISAQGDPHGEFAHESMIYSADEEKYSSSGYVNPHHLKTRHRHQDEQYYDEAVNKSFGSEDASPPTARRQLQYCQEDPRNCLDASQYYDPDHTLETEQEYVSETEKMVNVALNARRQRYNGDEEGSGEGPANMPGLPARSVPVIQQKRQPPQQQPSQHVQVERGGALPEGALDAEGARALIAALEASRGEVITLRQALSVAQQSAEYYRTECEKLTRKSHEEGSLLKAEDRAKYKKALQDLKDYEVYREVMESAMTRMQQEMEKVEQECEESRAIQKQLEKDIRKSKSIQNKVLQDAESNQKGRKDLGRRLEMAEDKLVEASKEREAAVVALSQFKSDKARELGDLQTSLHRKDVEIRNLKKKYNDLESKMKNISSDFAASNTIHEQEMKKIKAAHSKSLEMLMSYQEENDLLRSTMSELIDKKEDSSGKADEEDSDDVDPRGGVL